MSMEPLVKTFSSYTFKPRRDTLLFDWQHGVKNEKIGALQGTN